VTLTSPTKLKVTQAPDMLMRPWMHTMFRGNVP
jgi:hypothetical protein